MSNYIIKETFTLPSKGMIYDSPINPEVTLRSMTTMDELKRLSPNENEFQVLANLIEDCIVGNLGMRVYDLCIGDFTFLLHKLRIVSYGAEYKMLVECPKCHSLEEQIFDLETLETIEYKKGLEDLLKISLPMSKIDISLKFTTPRMIDTIARKRKEYLKKNPEAIDPQFLLNIEELIDEVDGKKLSFPELENFVQNLPIKDANFIIQKAEEFNRAIGLDTTFINECKVCGYTYPVSFRYGLEFFRPTTY